MIIQTLLPSPIDDIIIQGSENGVSYVGFYPPKNYSITALSEVTNDAILCAAAQLNEYFAKQRTTFTVPLDTQGTVFQQSVWQALLNVPYGELKTYGDIAKVLNNPKAVRAVGAANGKNPISIIVPCHRIIGANAKLTGYAGGLARKQWLLQHETG
ncbi:methylated-DNA--[protein]-cysteine S-methyltransferase [Pseudoalteromonas nigrifaciens]|uniref:methylated-DNA--[protein]-cysteine S-methyltransferase n=1 Tax=Pseudoalteromonas nigrifaciens TaxID=28109 RepID=UPI0017886683|nr:methylated-DNA--[protein]-cysteine S-methyltransferase [Pseudoalteromonas nigrifaciens]MBE0421021.1 methylated-DNA--[protein]-cysteine S-methyltransferase [Pseudoalteromonas nigrifaciens]